MRGLFITNRPNYCHRRFAETIGCKFYHVKHYIPENIPVLSLPINGFLNSMAIEEADFYFAESAMDYYPVYYKNPEGKKIILIAEDTVFKLEFMEKIRKNYIIKLYRSADGFIAISDLCKEMVLKYAKKPVGVAYPFPHKEFFHIKSNLETKNVVFIGRNDKTKGFPELVEAVRILRTNDPEWNLYLIGECSKSVTQEEGIHPLGYVEDIEPYLQKSTFFVHPAYFDPCPATIFEAMNAGMVTVISGNIGQSSIFRKSGLSNLVIGDVSPKAIAANLESLVGRDLRQLSSKLRSLSRQYRERERLAEFKKQFNLLMEEM